MENVLLYLDPGSGSMIIQLLIASLLGVVTFFKHIKVRVKHFFSKPSDNASQERE